MTFLIYWTQLTFLIYLPLDSAVYPAALQLLARHHCRLAVQGWSVKWFQLLPFLLHRHKSLRDNDHRVNGAWICLIDFLVHCDHDFVATCSSLAFFSWETRRRVPMLKYICVNQISRPASSDVVYLVSKNMSVFFFRLRAIEFNEKGKMCLTQSMSYCRALVQFATDRAILVM